MQRRLTTVPLIAGVLAASLAAPVRAETPVCFEAEATTQIEAPMRSISAANVPVGQGDIVKQASGESYIEVPEGAGKPPEVTTGQAVLEFRVPSDGEYILWCRVWWDDGCGNSLSIAIDDSKPFVFGQDTTYKCWHWVKSPPRIKQLTLTKGTHTLTFLNREDGIRIDQVLLSKNRRYVPVDIEESTASPATAGK